MSSSNQKGNNALQLLLFKKAEFWEAERIKENLSLFRRVVKKVPAYKDFLRKNGINPAKIKTSTDFLSLPVMDKNNYLRRYPLQDLCWGGKLDGSLVFAATSGTTGGPFYFPRDTAIDWQSSVFHELFLCAGEKSGGESTLVIVCFGMGVWIGGLITYEALQKVSERGYPLSIITPGINKEEIYNALKSIGSQFGQVVLCGYPPFIKDLVDEAETKGIHLKSIARLRIIFAAEAFSEKFRDYIVRKAGIKNLYTDTMNIYGSADLGTMAEETPLSIFARRLATQNERFYKNLFPEAGERLPTLVQYNPAFINFEESKGTLLATAYNYLPLIRYQIGDRGGIIPFRKMVAALAEEGVSLCSVARKTGAPKIPQLPFVYLYERLDMSTKLYGANIFSEHVREALQDHALEDFVTGKFTMSTISDRKQNQHLLINLELKEGVRESSELQYKALDAIVKNLLQKNAEYRNNYLSMRERVVPELQFWPYHHPQYFTPGIKQKWVAGN